MPNEQRHYSNELNLESVGINLPYNMQAEQSVLGAVLLKPETLTDLVEIIRPEMFYTRQNAQIWSEMLRLFTNDQTIDILSGYIVWRTGTASGRCCGAICSSGWPRAGNTTGRTAPSIRRWEKSCPGIRR